MKKDKDMFPVIENEEDAMGDVVELYDENGNLVQFNIIASLDVDDQEYAILSNVENEEEVIIFRVSEEKDDFVFESIEDQDELDSVMEAYNELLDELDEDE